MLNILENLKMENIEKIEFIFKNLDFLFVNIGCVNEIYIGDIKFNISTRLQHDGYYTNNFYSSNNLFIHFNSSINKLNYVSNIGGEIKNVEERLTFNDIASIEFYLKDETKISINPKWKGPSIKNFYQIYDKKYRILSIDEKDTINQKICRNCKQHDDFTWVCCNGDSEYRADMTDDKFDCEYFEYK